MKAARAATALAAAGLLLLSAFSGAAQEAGVDPPASLRPGDRLEVWSPLLVDRRERGVLERLEPDSLIYRVGGGDGVRRIPLSTVRRIRVAGSPEPATLRGAFFGVLAGVAGAIAWDEATGERNDAGLLVEPRWGLRAAIIAGGGAAGALAGWMVRVPRWEEVPVPGEGGRGGGNGGEGSYLQRRFRSEGRPRPSGSRFVDPPAPVAPCRR